MVLLPIAILIFGWGVSLLATPGSGGFEPRGTFGVALVLLGTAIGAVAATLIVLRRRRFVKPS